MRLQQNIKIEPSTWKAPDKILAFSDIEGEFEALRLLLIANKVMSKKFHWTFGTGHVVICGDLFDRGMNVTEQLWLLYKLEQEAVAQGGYLHVILGNHDIMNLSNDTRYVQPKYLETANLFHLDYKDLYGENTELGRWLRSKNIVEKIGDVLCLHAGVSPTLNDLKIPINKINETARPYYAKSETSEVQNSNELFPLFSGNTSPFWYRGYFMQPVATQQQVDNTLFVYGVNKILVGHTIAPHNISGYYNGKVIGLDVDQHNHQNLGVLFEKGQWFIVNAAGQRAVLKNN